MPTWVDVEDRRSEEEVLAAGRREDRHQRTIYICHGVTVSMVLLSILLRSFALLLPLIVVTSSFTELRYQRRRDVPLVLLSCISIVALVTGWSVVFGLIPATSMMWTFRAILLCSYLLLFLLHIVAAGLSAKAGWNGPPRESQKEERVTSFPQNAPLSSQFPF